MNAPLDTDVAIETPEHTVFRYRVAGPARRSLGYLVDLIVCYGVVAIVAVLVMLAVMGDGGVSDTIGGAAKMGIGLLLLVLFAVQWVYFVAWEAASGRSPGKMATGIRVVTLEGRPIGARAAILRNLLRAADALPAGYLVGGVSMALTSRFQRLGDLVAGTMVVIPERPRPAVPFELLPPAAPAELAQLPDHVSLDVEERVAIEMFLRRRGTLGVSREQELARMIAAPIGTRVGYEHPDPVRMLAIVYDRAVNRGREDSPPSSAMPSSPPRSRGPSWR